MPSGGSVPTPYDAIGIIGLLLPKAFGHAMDVTATLLSNAGTMASNLLHNWINVHDEPLRLLENQFLKRANHRRCQMEPPVERLDMYPFARISEVSIVSGH